MSRCLNLLPPTALLPLLRCRLLLQYCCARCGRPLAPTAVVHRHTGHRTDENAMHTPQPGRNSTTQHVAQGSTCSCNASCASFQQCLCSLDHMHDASTSCQLLLRCRLLLLYGCARRCCPLAPAAVIHRHKLAGDLQQRTATRSTVALAHCQQLRLVLVQPGK